jgi:hypothetical protein
MEKTGEIFTHQYTSDDKLCAMDKVVTILTVSSGQLKRNTALAQKRNHS